MAPQEQLDTGDTGPHGHRDGADEHEARGVGADHHAPAAPAVHHTKGKGGDEERQKLRR
jgi:hypothetical protein